MEPASTGAKSSREAVMMSALLLKADAAKNAAYARSAIEAVVRSDTIPRNDLLRGAS